MKGLDVYMFRLPRSKLITKIIVFALIVYAGISLITLRGQIEAENNEVHDLRRAVVEQEIANSQLEYDILHHDTSAVRANIARNNLGLVPSGDGDIVLIEVDHGFDLEN